ncbi:hypothetical protein BDV12DRAFT_129079 [Aspergillus spectabilis]
MGSRFVKLLSFNRSDVQDFQSQSVQYLLKFAEMWLCCAFQSLSPTAFGKYFLPASPII